MEITNVSINNNRVAINLSSGKTAQFVVWDLQKSQHEDLQTQIKTAFAISPDFNSIQKHLKINGYDASLEDIY